MKTTKIIFIAMAILVIAACSTTKKSATSASAPSSTAPLVLKVSNGIYPPGNEELTAIQAKYKDVTLDMLKQGHAIYTSGACINCHAAQNIYRYAEAQWVGIIDDMAMRAKISAAEKDAVFKYVLAIKATQPK